MSERTIRRKIHQTLTTSNEDQFIGLYIDAYASFFLPFDSRLTKTERLYLIELVKVYRKGVRIDSRSATNEVKKMFVNSKDKDRSVWIYRGKLKKKGWLIQTIDGVELSPFLQGEFDLIDFKIVVK